jgi:hypothetical protein
MTDDFCTRAFARPRIPGVSPEVGTARRIIEECRASSPRDHGDDEVWMRYGALKAALEEVLPRVIPGPLPR